MLVPARGRMSFKANKSIVGFAGVLTCRLWETPEGRGVYISRPFEWQETSVCVGSN